MVLGRLEAGVERLSLLPPSSSVSSPDRLLLLELFNSSFLISILDKLHINPLPAIALYSRPLLVELLLAVDLDPGPVAEDEDQSGGLDILQ